MEQHSEPTQPSQLLLAVLQTFGANLGTRDAAKVAGLSKSKLEKLRVSGGGPPFTKQGAKCTYAADLLLDWASKDRSTK